MFSSRGKSGVSAPTGTWSAESAVEDVVANSRGVVVLDEAYVDFAPESCVGLLEKHDREPIAGWFRITIGTRDQHQRLLGALKEILE
jgi:histidinol-phosphate/aromatic aminotransferase/cobyric acid decarboxylase-like protein